MPQLGFDSKWQIIPKDLSFRLDLVSPSRVRHDSRYAWQPYFHSFAISSTPGKFTGFVAQAISNPRGKPEMHTILDKVIPYAWPVLYIDEIHSKLYLTFHHGCPNPSRAPRQYIKIFNISFSESDILGYRKLCIIDEHKICKVEFCNSIDGSRSNFFGGIQPFFGLNGNNLMFTVGYTDNGMPFKRYYLGTLALGNVTKRSVPAEMCAEIEGTQEPLQFEFFHQDKNLAVFCQSTYYRSPPMFKDRYTADNDKYSMIKIYSIESEPAIQINLVTSHYIDDFKLVKNCLPDTVFAGLKAQHKIKNLKQWLGQFLTHEGKAFKFTLFRCGENGLIAIKHFHKKFLQSVLVLRQARWLSLSDKNLLKVNKSEGHIAKTILLGGVLYYELENESTQQITYRRLDLSASLRDYRSCSNCGKTENRKRRNAQGKRIAKFQVCRECKKHNFHQDWRKIPCHFCSFECVKNGWKEHKKIHINSDP